MFSAVAWGIEQIDWDNFNRPVDDTVTRLRDAVGGQEKVESAIRRYLEQSYWNYNRSFISPKNLALALR
jgi:hypothetical protein